MSELTDGQSCSVTAVPPTTTVPPLTTVPPTPTTTPTTQTPPCPSSVRTGQKVPPDVVKDENGEWLTDAALTDAIDDWCEREPVPAKDAAPGVADGADAVRLSRGLNQSHCPAGASATDDTVKVNVAAVLAADDVADRKVIFYPLRNDIHRTSSPDAHVVNGSAGGRSSWFSDVGQQFAATRCSDVAWA